MMHLEEKIEMFGSVNVRIFSQYDPDRELECVNCKTVDEALELNNYYSNDYVYFESPE